MEILDTNNIQELEDLVYDFICEKSKGSSIMTYEIRLALLNVAERIQKSAESQQRSKE